MVTINVPSYFCSVCAQKFCCVRLVRLTVQTSGDDEKKGLHSSHRIVRKFQGDDQKKRSSSGPKKYWSNIKTNAHNNLCARTRAQLRGNIVCDNNLIKLFSLLKTTVCKLDLELIFEPIKHKFPLTISYQSCLLFSQLVQEDF